VKGRLVPHYVLQVGGHVAERGARLAQGRNSVPARQAPDLVAALLDRFAESPECPDFESFLASHGEGLVGELAAGYTHVPDFDEDKNFYFDWGAEEVFSLAGRGPGECGAGAARALLVTRGQEARSPSEAVALFSRHFLDEGLVEASFRGLIEQARRAADGGEPGNGFAAEPERVSAFVETVRTLFENMDPSLRFKTSAEAATPVAETPAEPQVRIDREADFRGVVCPLNYVKTRMVLERLASGAVLSVLLDEEGSRNVPESVDKDGHAVLSVAPQSDHWRVLIRKA
jgi:sulfite reductase (ferredoxin)